MPHTVNDLAALRDQHRILAPSLLGFCEELERQLLALMAAGGVALGFPVQKRVKSWNSIEEKLQRVPISLRSLADLQDLVGFRLVLLFQRDVDVVCELLIKHLRVIKRYDTSGRLGDDRFGYSSQHIVIGIPTDWSSIPTFRTFGTLTAEVQVRTSAQHLWAEASQSLQYKRESSVPIAIRRSVARVSALLETIDLEFERLLSERERHDDEQIPKVEGQLDLDVLEKLLDKLLPEANKHDTRRSYTELLQDLHAFGITKVVQVRELAAAHLGEALGEEAETVAPLKPREEVPHTAFQKRLARGVFFTHVGLVRIMLQRRFGDAWDRYQEQQEGGIAEDDAR